jgi:hypothetical protein
MLGDWGHWGGSAWQLKYDLGNGAQYLRAGTEIERDCLSRYFGVYGYEFFVYSVNCKQYLDDNTFLDHIRQGVGGGKYKTYEVEGPDYRPETRNRSISAVDGPSAWVAVCHTPYINRNTNEVLAPSHFGVYETVAGDFRFNVLHLGGHVDDSVWKEADLSKCWLVQSRTGGGAGNTNQPYGWWILDPGNDGLLDKTPMFEGAFDQNAREFRKVKRFGNP